MNLSLPHAALVGQGKGPFPGLKTALSICWQAEIGMYTYELWKIKDNTIASGII